VAPDLYHGQIATTDEAAGKMMNALDFGKAVADIGQAAEYLKTNARCNGKVAVVGFCLGGALTFAAACNVPGLAAAVPFYGVPDIDKLDLTRVTAPIQAHFAQHDDWASPSKAEAIKKKLDALGKPMELHLYDAGHAFMRDTDPAKHSPAASKLAWERATAFLKKHLA
jgi:carboxymethylenebutenolidase